jgi:hypothetical protein
VRLPERIAGVFLLSPLFGQQIDYFPSFWFLDHTL